MKGERSCCFEEDNDAVATSEEEVATWRPFGDTTSWILPNKQGNITANRDEGGSAQYPHTDTVSEMRPREMQNSVKNCHRHPVRCFSGVFHASAKEQSVRT